jgi:hypothetical protein
MKGTTRCSDGAPYPSRRPGHRKNGPLSVVCPVCQAGLGVPCPTSGTHHTERVKAWREVENEERRKR